MPLRMELLDSEKYQQRVEKWYTSVLWIHCICWLFQDSSPLPTAYVTKAFTLRVHWTKGLHARFELLDAVYMVHSFILTV